MDGLFTLAPEERPRLTVAGWSSDNGAVEVPDGGVQGDDPVAWLLDRAPR